jgi:hypothetical protein
MEEDRTALQAGAHASSPRPPATPQCRTFSWHHWLPVAAVLAALGCYFYVRSGQLTALMIRPTVVLDARVGFTPATVRETLAALGPKGRRLYTEVNRVDFILTPLVLREFLLSTFPATSPRSDAIREVLASGYAIGDVTENVFVMIFLKGYPAVWDPFVWACCLGNLLKWSGFYAALLSILYEFVVYLRGVKLKTQ